MGDVENVPILEKEVEQKTKLDLLFGLSIPGRIIITLYTFHGLFFIYSLVIQYIILIPSLLYTIELNTVLKILISLFYLIFSISSSNILIIPSFEFLSFPFLLIRNPFSHLISFLYINNGNEFKKDKIEENDSILNIIFIIFEIIYFSSVIAGYVLNIIIFKDVVKFVIIILIYFYYLTIVFLYFFTTLYLLIKNLKNLKWRKNLKEKYEKKDDIPNVNLLSYLIYPILFKNYRKNNLSIIDDHYYFEDFVYDCGFWMKFVIMMLSTLSFVFICIKIIGSLLCIFWFFIFLCIMSVLSLGLNFPFCYKNRKNFGTFGCCCKFLCFKKGNNFFSTDIQYKSKLLHPIIISFTRFICDSIIILVSIALLYIQFLNDDNNDINNDIFANITPTDEIIDTKKMLLPNICYSSIHNIPLPLYLPFINDAYYYNNIKEETKKNVPKNYYSSSFDIDNYRRLFFNDEDYTIEVKGNLINKKNNVKMVQYNVRNKKNYVTILSIKGTSYNMDIYLDMQLYFSSILLNLLSTFSVLTEKGSLSFKLMEYTFNLPYRIFFKYLIIDEYLENLINAYKNNEKYFYKNVVIVGHSLGGGLSKLFGRIVGKQAISLSGPGINAFHSLWNYKGNSENFGISSIDLVPDKDLVPRVEISGGTIYRIICKEGVLNCHSKDNSLCEVLIMCRNPNYKSYCKNVANFKDSRINEIIEISELNRKKK